MEEKTETGENDAHLEGRAAGASQAGRRGGPARPRRMRFRQAFISIASMVALIFTCVVGFGAEPQVPLVFGTLVVGLVASWIGYSWDEMLEGMVEGITPALEAILILLLIGMLVGVWISSGTVPTMIYYGLQLINARFFLPTTALICTIVSFAIGSWGTLGTVGLAFMGIGLALGVPAPMVAGCIVTGAYCGEVVSPLSDATNLTAGGAVTSPLIPWNTCGIYCASILGVSAASYGRYAFLCLLLPLLMVVVGYIRAARVSRR